MSDQETRLCLLFRKQGQFFSIERIFAGLTPFFATRFNVLRWEAPYSSPRHILRNLSSARRTPADVYHITGDIHYITLALPRRRTIVTIHDCVFLYAHKGLKRRLLKWLFLDMPVRRSRLVTTISERTRQDIISNTGCPAEKVVVIPNPIDSHIFYTPAAFREQEPVILFIGATPNKNLTRVITALQGIPCRLEIVGIISEELTAALQNHGIRYRVESGLSDQQMAEKYAASDLVLFPSTFEGFGLPIIEGQKAGRPVITSNLSPMKEVAAGAACLVDPYDIASIRDGVLRVIGDREYRRQLVEDGLKNAERFIARNIALQYMDCYRQVLTA